MELYFANSKRGGAELLGFVVPGTFDSNPPFNELLLTFEAMNAAVIGDRYENSQGQPTLARVVLEHLRGQSGLRDTTPRRIPGIEASTREPAAGFFGTDAGLALAAIRSALPTRLPPKLAQPTVREVARQSFINEVGQSSSWWLLVGRRHPLAPPRKK